MIRQPIVAVMGHVDHGKTTILDCIRKSTVAKKEAGAITQHIGASEVPAENLRGLCSDAMHRMRIELKIPGLLFIDTPGHEAFTNLRERGGSIADIAVLVIDIAQGVQPQTRESIRILRQYKTPFLVAANKVDLITGWVPQKTSSFRDSIALQPEHAQKRVDERLYAIIGELYELGINAERFDRVEDFTKQVAIVPMSAVTGEGVSELLLSLVGLSQRYLEQQLRFEVSGPGKASILEVKEEKGLGNTVDIILYDGTLRKNDTVVFGTLQGAASTKVRGLLKPVVEPRSSADKFLYVDEVHAASGVKLFAPGLEAAVSGSPLLVAEGNEEELKKQIAEQLQALIFSSEEKGVLLRADTLGSVEALLRLLKEKGIPVRNASVGKVTRQDILEAAVVAKEDPCLGVIFSFNTRSTEDAIAEAQARGVRIFESNVVYTLLTNYAAWVSEEKEKKKKGVVLPWPAKVKVLPGCCFRASKPAIFGVEIREGKLKAKSQLMKEDGSIIGEVKAIQAEKESIPEAAKGAQVAISLDEPVFHKNLFEGDVLLVFINRGQASQLEKVYGDELTAEEKALLEKILNITSPSVF